MKILVLTVTCLLATVALAEENIGVVFLSKFQKWAELSFPKTNMDKFNKGYFYGDEIYNKINHVNLIATSESAFQVFDSLDKNRGHLCNLTRSTRVKRSNSDIMNSPWDDLFIVTLKCD